MPGGALEDTQGGEDVVGERGEGLAFEQVEVFVGGGVNDEGDAVAGAEFVEERGIAGVAEDQSCLLS